MISRGQELENIYSYMHGPDISHLGSFIRLSILEDNGRTLNDTYLDEVDS